MFGLFYGRGSVENSSYWRIKQDFDVLEVRHGLIASVMKTGFLEKRID